MPGSVADGTTVLDFNQAERAARGWATMAVRASQKAEKAGALTVGDAVRAYIAARVSRSAKAGSDAEHRLGFHVLKSPLEAVPLASLTERHLEEWRDGLKRGGKRASDAPLAVATLARLLNDLRAALNAAKQKHKIGGDFDAILRDGLRAPQNAQVARGIQVLPHATVEQIVAAARAQDDDLGALVLVLAITGCRFDQAARITVGDVQPANRRIMVPASKKGRGTKAAMLTPIPITEEDMGALLPLTFGRLPDEPLLMRWHHKRNGGSRLVWVQDGRRPWQDAAEMTRGWRGALEACKLPSSIIPYALRAFKHREAPQCGAQHPHRGGTP